MKVPGVFRVRYPPDQTAARDPRGTATFVGLGSKSTLFLLVGSWNRSQNSGRTCALDINNLARILGQVAILPRIRGMGDLSVCNRRHPLSSRSPRACCLVSTPRLQNPSPSRHRAIAREERCLPGTNPLGRVRIDLSGQVRPGQPGSTAKPLTGLHQGTTDPVVWP